MISPYWIKHGGVLPEVSDTSDNSTKSCYEIFSKCQLDFKLKFIKKVVNHIVLYLCSNQVFIKFINKKDSFQSPVYNEKIKINKIDVSYGSKKL